MRRAPPVLLLVAGAVFLLAPAGLFAGPPSAEDTSTPAATSQQPDKLPAILDAIHQAPEPSSAIDAYAKGSAIAPDDPTLQGAFVRRMVEFGLPLIGEAQARSLVQHDEKNGLAWGVLAYALGARGETADALIDIGRAVQYSADDPFVQRTAGQLLAWYDALADQANLPKAAKKAAEDVGHALANEPAYADAYRQARQTYEQQKEVASLGEADVVPPVEEYPQTVPPTYNSYNYNYEAPDYAYPSEPYPQYVPYLAYPGFIGGYYNGCWWPSTSSVIVVPQARDGIFCDHGVITHREPDHRGLLHFPMFDRSGSFAHHEGQPGISTPHREHNAWNWRSNPGRPLGRIGPAPGYAGHDVHQPAVMPRGQRGSRQWFSPAPSFHRSDRAPAFAPRSVVHPATPHTPMSAPRAGHSSSHVGRGGRH